MNSAVKITAEELEKKQMEMSSEKFPPSNPMTSEGKKKKPSNKDIFIDHLEEELDGMRDELRKCMSDLTIARRHSEQNKQLQEQIEEMQKALERDHVQKTEKSSQERVRNLLNTRERLLTSDLSLDEDTDSLATEPHSRQVSTESEAWGGGGSHPILASGSSEADNELDS